MPSAHAQTAPIRAAYRDAGLDPLLAQERCHFFEAHGTGTRAGDPVEAQAIRDAFFPPELRERQNAEDSAASNKLLVGSMKTVIGHLEGCAGLAGLIKASLAIQNRVVPPNMHFTDLNPDIAPFYNPHLEVPTASRPWPEISGQPLRASVNSFGFGGTNAHVVLESFQVPVEMHKNGQQSESLEAPCQKDGHLQRFIGPLTFSAQSKTSLVEMVKAHASHLHSNEGLDLVDLTWTLLNRRSKFGFRAFFSGATREKLLASMDSYVEDAATSTPASGGAESVVDDPAMLGIFTGQGAQWALMGRHLIAHCHLFRESIARCEESLAELGAADAPQWRIRDRLIADKDTSRIGNAALSQPLCSAIQIATVDLLKACGVRFRAVVGHSSGEIAAAYCR